MDALHRERRLPIARRRAPTGRDTAMQPTQVEESTIQSWRPGWPRETLSSTRWPGPSPIGTARRWVK